MVAFRQLGGAMAQKFSNDTQVSLSIGTVAPSVLVLLFAMRYLHLPAWPFPDTDRPIWSNIYLSSQRTGYGMLMILVFIGLNRAFGIPKRLLAPRIIFLAGLAGIILAVGNLANLVPHYGLYDSLGGRRRRVWIRETFGGRRASPGMAEPYCAGLGLCRPIFARCCRPGLPRSAGPLELGRLSAPEHTRLLGHRRHCLFRARYGLRLRRRKAKPASGLRRRNRLDFAAFQP